MGLVGILKANDDGNVPKALLGLSITVRQHLIMQYIARNFQGINFLGSAANHRLFIHNYRISGLGSHYKIILQKLKSRNVCSCSSTKILCLQKIL